jgi:uncharacterized oxidoreductase
MAEVNINVGGVIRTTSAFIDILAANKGTIINVSSALAFVPLPSAPIYSATKANLLAFMRRLAHGFINRQLWNASRKLVPVGTVVG